MLKKPQSSHPKFNSDVEKLTKNKYKNLLEGGKLEPNRISYDMNDNTLHMNLNTEGNILSNPNILEMHNDNKENKIPKEELQLLN